ncbi:MAG: hypothetical protein ACOC0A_01105, partial [Planctomycetota bacterium]
MLADVVVGDRYKSIHQENGEHDTFGEVGETAIDFYESEALRYFANVVGKYSRPVLKAIDRVSDLQVDIVAPAHGLVWRENPGKIVELYEKWAGFGSGPAEPGITIVYGSMYGFTERIMNAVA